MDLKEAIEQLESLKTHCEMMIDRPEEIDAADLWKHDAEALNIAVDALRTKV